MIYSSTDEKFMRVSDNASRKLKRNKPFFPCSSYATKWLLGERTDHLPLSGEDESYRASELNSHGPTVVGWQSAPECSYPQELILQLQSTATVQKIQVLAHQYLIRQYY
jgi:hypothetical protein